MKTGTKSHLNGVIARYCPTKSVLVICSICDSIAIGDNNRTSLNSCFYSQASNSLFNAQQHTDENKHTKAKKKVICCCLWIQRTRRNSIQIIFKYYAQLSNEVDITQNSSLLFDSAQANMKPYTQME